MQALLMPVGEELYAVDVAVAREVIAAPVISSLPTTTGAVLGVVNLRGEIIPVFDTAVLLGLGAPITPQYAAVVDTVLGPAALTTSAHGEAAELGDQVGLTDTPGTDGAFAVDGRLVVVLDVDALLGSVRLAG